MKKCKKTPRTYVPVPPPWKVCLPSRPPAIKSGIFHPNSNQSLCKDSKAPAIPPPTAIATRALDFVDAKSPTMIDSFTLDSLPPEFRPIKRSNSLRIRTF